jgi:UDP:flavonoid glycosyltransferase YjiC (YdhE family)
MKAAAGGPLKERIPMSERVLLAWELGGGRGHGYILGWIAEALRARGYETVFAVQRLDVLGAMPSPAAPSDCFQAPIWPGLLDRTQFWSPDANATMGDALAGVGMQSAVAVTHMLCAWDRLISTLRPAVVVADYAPACILAARGKVPVVAVGDGFTVPPSAIARFPAFEPDAPIAKYDEQLLTSIVNDSLRAIGRRSIERLPQVFEADRSCPGSFVEFDPYAAQRSEPAAAPWVPDWDRTVRREKDEVYCYLSMNTVLQRTVLAALATLATDGMRVTVHAPSTSKDALQVLLAAGAVIEPAPLPFQEIQRRARLVVSYGSLGFVSSALAAGIPQVVMPLGIGRSLTGKTIDRLGVGRWLPVNPNMPFEAALLAQAISECYADERLLTNAGKLAADFARRLEPRPATVVADLVDALL